MNSINTSKFIILVYLSTACCRELTRVSTTQCSERLLGQRRLTQLIVANLHENGAVANLISSAEQFQHCGALELATLTDNYITSVIFGSMIRLKPSVRNATVKSPRFCGPGNLHVDAFRVSNYEAETGEFRGEFSLEWQRTYGLVAGKEVVRTSMEKTRFTDYFLNFHHFSSSAFTINLEQYDQSVHSALSNHILIVTMTTQTLVSLPNVEDLALPLDEWPQNGSLLAIGLRESTCTLSKPWQSPSSHGVSLQQTGILCTLKQHLKNHHYAVVNATQGTAGPKRFKRSIRSHHHGRLGSRAIYTSVMTELNKHIVRWETNVPSPARLLTWATVITLCILVGIMLAVIKVMTMTAPDKSWHDYIIQQLLQLLYKQEKREEVSDHFAQELVNLPESERGKTSKSILVATIRIVSFILVALYEGNLYNTITISRTGTVPGTLDNLLLASQKWQVVSALSFAPNDTLANEKVSKISLPSTIQDCLTWSDVRLNRGCVTYEFDPRNLPSRNAKYRFHRQELWKKLPSLKMKRSNHPVFALFQPLAQFCQWMVETWTFHAWNSLEKVFYARKNVSSDAEAIAASIVTPDSENVVVMRDYYGLLFIYFFLSFAAALIFVLEVSLSRINSWLKKRPLDTIRVQFLRWAICCLLRIRSFWLLHGFRFGIGKRRRLYYRVTSLVNAV